MSPDSVTKEFIAKCIKEALAIAKRLYAADKPRYKPLFAAINKSIKQHRSPVLILQAVKRMAEKEGLGSDQGSGSEYQPQPKPQPALDITEYFFGTLRKLEAEREAKRLRKGGAIENVKALDALAEMMRRAGYTVEKKHEA